MQKDDTVSKIFSPPPNQGRQGYLEAQWRPPGVERSTCYCNTSRHLQVFSDDRVGLVMQGRNGRGGHESGEDLSGAAV